MAPEEQARLQIGHVLFINIVGYSKLLPEEQKERVRQLTSIVVGTGQVRESTDEQLVRLAAPGNWTACSRRVQRAQLRRTKTAAFLGPAPRRSALRKNRRLVSAERELNHG